MGKTKTQKFGAQKGPAPAPKKSAGKSKRTNPGSSAPPPNQGANAPQGGQQPAAPRQAAPAQEQQLQQQSMTAPARQTLQVDPQSVSAGDARRTVMMQPFDAPAAMAQESPHAAPEIELVRHELPGDAPTDPRLVLVNDADSERAAAFRVLRHHLLERGHPQVVAVSGPSERCGKTTTAINLALALAECGRGSVLLLDGNLRRPELAGIFRFIPPWCFAEQLVRHREQPFLPWGFVEIPSLWLHVAAINPRSEEQHRLDAPAFAIAMDRLRLANYDHIVIDCPPVLGNADVNLIQDSADGVLLCAQVKKATARDIRQSVDQLTPTKILGTALLES